MKTQPSGQTMAFGVDDFLDMPDLSGQSVRSVTEICSSLGIVPTLIGSGLALEQSPDPGTQVQRGARVTIRFGRAGAPEQGGMQGAGN